MKKATASLKFQVFEWLNTENPDSFIGFGIRVRINGKWIYVKQGDKYIWKDRSEATSFAKEFIGEVALGN